MGFAKESQESEELSFLGKTNDKILEKKKKKKSKIPYF